VTITGIDLLFVVIGFILLFLLVEASDRYRNWSEWDRDRRRKRRHERYILKDQIAEKEYRRRLRFEFTMNLFSIKMKKMKHSFDDVTRAIKNFNEIIGRLN
jgi:hypothetical protein